MYEFGKWVIFVKQRHCRPAKFEKGGLTDTEGMEQGCLHEMHFATEKLKANFTAFLQFRHKSAENCTAIFPR